MPIGNFCRYLVPERKLGFFVKGTWKSPNSKAVYPARWRLQVPLLAMNLTITPNLENQKMKTVESTEVTYWEGSISVRGSKKGSPITGNGYVELTGYAKAFDAL